MGLKRPGNRNVPKASEETELEPHPAAPAAAYWPAWRGQEGSGQCPSQWEQGGGRRGQREGRCLGSPSLGSSGQRPHVAARGAAPSLGTSQLGGFLLNSASHRVCPLPRPWTPVWAARHTCLSPFLPSNTLGLPTVAGRRLLGHGDAHSHCPHAEWGGDIILETRRDTGETCPRACPSAGPLRRGCSHPVLRAPPTQPGREGGRCGLVPWR